MYVIHDVPIVTQHFLVAAASYKIFQYELFNGLINEWVYWDPFLIAVNKGTYQEKESCFGPRFGSPMVVQARLWVTAWQQEDGTVRSHLSGSDNREKNAGTQIAFILFFTFYLS